MKPPPFEPVGDLALGDYVSVPKYPRGTVRGWVVVSERALFPWTDHDTGERWLLPALVVVAEYGTDYGPIGTSARKLARQRPIPVEFRERMTRSAPVRRGVVRLPDT